MANESTSVSGLLFQTSHTIRNIQNTFRDSLIGLDDRSTPKVLFFLTDRISNSLRRRLEDISKELQNNVDTEGAEVEARSISKFTDELAQIYEIVKNSRDTGNLRFITRPFEQLARHVFYDTRIIVNSVTEYNYTYEELVSSLLNTVAGRVQGVTELGLIHEDIPRKIIRLGFPVAESNNVLSYAGLAHEMSHFIYAVKELEGECGVKYSAQDYETIDAIVQNSLRKAESRPFEPDDRSQLEDEITQMVHGWVKEVVCDCLAVHIMGPAFLFALFDTLSLRGDIYEWREAHLWRYYPPPIVRFGNILQCLGRLQPFKWEDFELVGHRQEEFDEVKEATAHAIHDVEAVSDVERLKLDEKHKLAFHLTKTTLQRLHEDDFFVKNTSDISFPMEEFRKYFMRLYSKLKKHIPINEVGEGIESREVPNFRVILNVGWVYHLVTRSRFRSYNYGNDRESNQELERLNKVLKKSLELSELDTLFHGEGR